MERLGRMFFYLPAAVLLAALLTGLTRGRTVEVFAPPGAQRELTVIM